MGHCIRTPLHSFHLKHKARLGVRAGCEVPVGYTTAFEEHRAVRLRAGLVDEGVGSWVRLIGKGALVALNGVLTGDVSNLPVHTAFRSLWCNSRGGVESDAKVLALGDEDLLVQLGGIASSAAFIEALGKGDFSATDETSLWGAIGLYGPRSEKILSCITACDLPKLAPAVISSTVVGGEKVYLLRIQRLGETGFFILSSSKATAVVAEALFDSGHSLGLCLVGREAWEALALEAGEPRFGAELNPTITPLEAGLERYVDFDKPVSFAGKKALEAQKAKGTRRQIVYFTFEDRRIARSGISVWQGDHIVGEVVGGALSPMLELPMGTALVTLISNEKSELFLKVREKSIPLHIKKPPLHLEAQGKEEGAWSFVKGLAGVCVLI